MREREYNLGLTGRPIAREPLGIPQQIETIHHNESTAPDGVKHSTPSTKPNETNLTPPSLGYIRELRRQRERYNPGLGQH